MSYRCNPIKDTHVVPYRELGHGPRTGDAEPDSAMLIDATMKHPMPPLALPKREYMENAKALWERLGLPPLRPRGAVVRLFARRLERDLGRERATGRARPRHGPRRLLPATAPQGHRAQHADRDHRGNQG